MKDIPPDIPPTNQPSMGKVTTTLTVTNRVDRALVERGVISPDSILEPQPSA